MTSGNSVTVQVICLCFPSSDSQQDVSSCPQGTYDIIGLVVGCGVAVLTVSLIIVGVVIVTYLILRHKKQGAV